jgi:hypothetical protein
MGCDYYIYTQIDGYFQVVAVDKPVENKDVKEQGQDQKSLPASVPAPAPAPAPPAAAPDPERPIWRLYETRPDCKIDQDIRMATLEQSTTRHYFLSSESYDSDDPDAPSRAEAEEKEMQNACMKPITLFANGAWRKASLEEKYGKRLSDELLDMQYVENYPIAKLVYVEKRQYYRRR